MVRVAAQREKLHAFLTCVKGFVKSYNGGKKLPLIVVSCLVMAECWLNFISYGNADEITEIRQDIPTPILRGINSSP